MRERKPVLPPTPHGEAEVSAPNPLIVQAAGFALTGIDAFTTLVAVMMLGGAGLFLTIAWQFGPQVWIDAAHYRAFTERADAAIVESWAALALDQSSIRSPANWRASAKARRCAVVEYGASWGAPTRRAFCGPQLDFNDSYTLAGLTDIAPQVPFVWSRDERGFAVTEIRLDASAQQWLASHEPDTFMHRKWPAKSALDWLRLELDVPVDLAIAGWASAPPTMKIAFDPKNPLGALPAATVASRASGSFNPLAVIVGGAGGLALWFSGMWMLPWLRNFTPVGRWVIAALPLLGLPWFADQFPSALRAMNVSVAEIVADMFGDIDKLGAMTSLDPSEAARADSVRLVWRAGDGAYADTFGTLRFAPPKSPYATSDAALAALVDAVTTQVGVMDDASRTTLFANLRRDKQNDLKGAGVVFMTAAKAAIADPQANPGVRRAAKAFLSEWLTSPTEDFDKYSLGYKERKRLYADVEDVR